MYNSIASLLISFLFLSGCNNAANTDPVKKDNLQTVSTDTVPADKPGSDRDEHGCIGSAGYRWSIVKDSCIRIFETGIKMEARDASLDKTLAAFVIFSNDRVRAEIFLPTQKKQVIIRRTEGSGDPAKWANGLLILSLSDGMYTLYDDGKLLYSGSSSK